MAEIVTGANIKRAKGLFKPPVKNNNNIFLSFGGYDHNNLCFKVLKILQKIFQLRSCTNQEFKNRSRPCLLYDIKQCSAPCVGKVSYDDYKHQVQNTIDFFKGNQNDITKDLEKEMLTASKLQKYERASEIRDSIQSLNFIIREEIKVGSQDSNYDFINNYNKNDLSLLNNLDFQQIDIKKFPVVSILKKIPESSSLFETLIVSANDQLVDLFLDNRIQFVDIYKKLSKLISLNEFSKYKKIKPKKIDDIAQLDNFVRLKIKSNFKNL